MNENGTIEQVNHYYPFGGVYSDLSYNAELQSLNFAKGSKQEHLEMENKKYEKVNLYQQVMNQIEQFFKHK